MKRTAAAVSLGLLIAATHSSGLRAEAQENASKPLKLLLFLVVDQARMEYLDRFGPSCTGGLRHLLDQGVVFERAYHDHAISNTGPGHATLATGVHPGRSGIVSNEWYDRESEGWLYCVEDEDAEIVGYPGHSDRDGGRSPFNLIRSALPDWIRASQPESRVFTASRKDRAAVLMGGRAVEAAYWIDTSRAEFVSSTFYLRRYPQWAVDFRDQRIPDKQFGRAWTPLPQVESADPSLQLVQLDTGVLRWGFPHVLGGATPAPTSSFYSDYSSSPYIDFLLAEFAKSLIEGESLGQDDTLDYLGLSFSALDMVGHDYGPNSPEVFDTILRLDQALEGLFRYIDEKIGLENVGIVFSSDHGVAPFPEFERPLSGRGNRADAGEISCIQGIGDKLEEKYGSGPWFEGGLYLDYSRLGRRNLLRASVESDLREWIEDCPGVQRVWTRTQLESGEISDPFLQLYRNSFHVDRSPDLYVQATEYHLWGLDLGTSHGTPWDYDRHVPVIFVWPGATPKRDGENRFRTIDVAPTLASLLGIPYPDDLDGADRSRWIR